MRVKTVKVADLTLDPANARTHPARNLGALKDSLQRFGQQKPIVIEASGLVRAGNGTVLAARELEWKTLKAVVTDLEGDEAVGYALADNRTAELAIWDWEQLAQLLDQVPNASQLGWDETELRDIINAQWTLPTRDDALETTQSIAARLSFSAKQWTAISEAIEKYRSKHGEDISDADALVGICNGV